MSSSDPAAEKEALATLRLLRKHIDVSGFNAEDLDTLATWWTTIDEPKPKDFSLGGAMAGLVFPLFDPGDLEPRLVPCSLAIRALASAIQNGLPGAELETEGFLRDCGFDEGRIQEILGQMIARAPEPDPQDVN